MVFNTGKFQFTFLQCCWHLLMLALTNCWCFFSLLNILEKKYDNLYLLWNPYFTQIFKYFWHKVINVINLTHTWIYRSGGLHLKGGNFQTLWWKPPVCYTLMKNAMRNHLWDCESLNKKIKGGRINCHLATMLEGLI